MDRRQFVTRSAVVGAAAWTVPTITRVGSAAAESPVTFTAQTVSGSLPGPETSSQDVYQFEVLEADTQVRLVVASAIDGHPEVGIFAGPAATGTNLLTSSSFGYDPIVANYTTAYVLLSPGTYSFAIEPGLGNGTGGTYAITVESTKPVGAAVQVVDNGPETMLVDR